MGETRQDSAPYEVFRLRLAGYRRAAAKAGLPPSAVRVWEQPGHSVADGCAAGHALLSLPGQERPTAVLASTDVLALGVLQAARDQGLDVPRDLSVTGYDDIEESSRGVPPLTTVHQDLYEQGQDCARRLIDPGAVTTLLHPTRLIIRDSTAPRRGRHDHYAGAPVRDAHDLRWLPQLLRTWRRGRADDISYTYLAVFATGVSDGWPTGCSPPSPPCSPRTSSRSPSSPRSRCSRPVPAGPGRPPR